MALNSEQPIWQQHQRFMAMALQLAERAFEEGEVPVGAVVVKDNQVVGKGYNQVERLNDPTAHAEMIAISAACDTLDSKYLKDCTLYVTLEPCPMCAGASVWSKMGSVVFGASDAKYGASGSVFNITQSRSLNHRVEVIQGILEMDCEYLLKAFFETKRLKS
ncbi:MAG TPA: tRNA adenosine(34) deaminase TadA [Balneolaceae bacterium]|nr:tRNA adenosine(34) deaminase TadA [Balneolaceae bacterium]|tara:strand:+ start:178495 stop:178980 length:486 start_codon:yes stop_codon:yes gene_type:complete